MNERVHRRRNQRQPGSFERAGSARPIAEAMEDRILHSADLSPLGLAAPPTTFTVLEQRLDDRASLAPATERLELAFIDSRTPPAAAEALQAGWYTASVPVATLLVAPDDDGLARIGAELGDRTGSPLSGLHLVLSEGADGTPLLGSSRLGTQELLGSAGSVAGWGDSLDAQASITLHGGGAGAAGFGRQLGELTGATVHAAPLAEPAAGDDPLRQVQQPIELVFIDAAVPDAAALIADLLAQRDAGRAIEVLRIAADEDGIARIGAALAGRSDIAAVHVISHGSAAALQLGSGRLDSAVLSARAEEIAAWAGALTSDADLLFYGCDLASDPAGRALLDRLAGLTGADVAASTDPTGAARLGGDWDLEYRHGDVAAMLAPGMPTQQSWSGLLATYSVAAGVSDGAVGSLRWAIGEANASVGVDDIIELAAGTHALTLSGLADDSNASGDLDISGNLTLRGLGSGAAATQIEAGALGERALQLLGGTIAIENLTVRGGSAGAWSGGAIRVETGATLNMSDAVVESSTAVSGAGISSAGTLTLTRVTLRNNIATGNGGALELLGTTTLTDVAIEGNRAASGAGIYSAAPGNPLQLERVTISGNVATGPSGAGGIHNIAAGLIASNVTISGNTSTGVSGAIQHDAAITISNATIAGNTGGYGISSDTLLVATLTNTILADNGTANANKAQNSGGWNLDSGSSAGLSQPTDRSSTPAGLGALAANGGYTKTMIPQAGSAAIGNGNPSAPATDQRGMPRSGTPEIGAAENTAPTISAIGNQTIAEDGTLGPMAFTISDAETAAGSLVLSAQSSNPALVPVASISFGGSGVNRTLTAVPVANASGSSTLTITVSEDANSSSTVFTLTVNAVNDAPVIVSNGGAASTAISIPENSTAVTTVAATDADLDAPIFSIAGGADAASFSIDGSSGALRFVSAPNREAPTDAGANNVYDVIVRAADAGGASSTQAIAVTVTDVTGVAGQPNGVLWFATTDSGTATGLPFGDRDIVQFGTADDRFDINGGDTAGTLSKLPGFAAAEKLRGLHYVETTLTIGTGNNQKFTVNPGDLLVVFNNDSVTLNSNDGIANNTFTAEREDVVVFRPHSAGDYSSGTYHMLIEDGVYRSGVDRDIHAIALVEADTMVGGTLLRAGTLLVAHEGGSEDSNVYTVDIQGTGEGLATKTSVRQLLLQGSSIGLTARIQGLHLLNHDTAFNDTLLARGTLLVAIDATNTVGGTSMTNLDIVALSVSKTQQDAVPGSVATGTLLFDGSDIGLTAAQPKNFAGFTVATTTLPTNTPPLGTSNTSPTVNENTTFVTTLSATDVEGGALGYSIVGGEDQALFTITGGNQLRFIAAPDYESPFDANANNRYVVQVRVTDSVGAATEQLILVDVANVNEAPVANADTQTATEDSTRSVLSPGLLANDTDVDAGDSRTITGVSFGAVNGTVGSDLTGTYGTLRLQSNGSYTYTPSTAAAQALAAGQTAVETFGYTIRDSGGLTSSSTVTFTITGVNDAVTTPVQNLAVGVTELTGTPSGNLSGGNTITFADVDLNDAHAVSPTGTPTGTVLGAVTAVENSDTTGTGAGGLLTWTYTVAASAVEYLAGGQTKVESFTLTIDDVQGSTASRVVTATITGTNDPVVITAETLSAALTEQVMPSGNRTASGTIDFSDVDLADVHLISATGTPVGSVLGSLTAVKNSDTTNVGTGGRMTWTYSVAASALEYLAAGQTRTDSFTVTINDQKGSLVTRQIDVTITGTNDAILITGQDLTGAITEPVTPSGVLSDSGSITFTDADHADVHTVSANGTPIGSVLGTLTAVKNTDTTGSGTGGRLTWNYSVAASAVEYLAAGESLVERFTIQIDDGQGTLLTRQIDVTISGTNDIALIVSEDLVGAIMEAVTPSGNLTDSGSITFTDRDLSDVHLVSASGTPVGTVLGSLTAVKNSDTTGTGTGGQLTWNYSVAASAVEYLAAGQTRTEQFDITLNDQKGGVMTRRIAVTITGTNDAIVFTSEDLVGAITEPVTPSGNLIDSGSIAFTDRDLSDVHTVSASGTPIGSVLGTLTAVKNSDTTGTGTGGALTWSYSVAASAVEYLAAGESRTDSYTITLTDSNGSLVTKQIDVTITGTNDVALIVSEDLVGAITEPVTPSGNLTDSGSISFTDRDLSDVHLVSANGTPVGTVLGSLTAVKNSDTTGTGTGGALTWNYSVAASAVEYLAAGQTRTEQFDITLNDQKGGIVTRRIAVTVTGTNDAIVITSEDLVGAITEPVTPSGNLTDSGSIAFTDVDLTDVHTVSATGTPIGSVLGTLAAVKNSDTTGSGTGGQLTWTYSVAASAVEYLASGESRTDSYTITLTDSNGSLVTRQIDVTISGTNDIALIVSEDLVGAITEPVTPSGNLTDSGSISFTDRDLSDVHLVSASGTPVGSVLGTLTTVKNGDTTGTGTGGALTWNYSVAASAVEYLAAGQTRTEQFDITLDDQKGGVVTRRIAVTITGTNDAIVITSEDLVGAITEPVTPSGNLTDSGSIAFTDVDLTDVHTVSATGTPIGSVLGTLTAVRNSDTTGSGTGGQLTWTYSVAASAVEYLAVGESRTDSYTITLTDSNGSLVTRQIDVTITGTNDAIVITSEDLVGAITEPVTPSGVLSDSGSIAFTDRDLSDVHTVSASGTPIGSVLGTLAAVKNSDTTGSGIGGQLTWTYSVAASAVEYLASGESRTDSYTITLSDSNGSLVTRQIDVTITGTNDIALIVAEDLVGEVTEPVTPSGNLTDSGSISFTDRDLSDVHLVSASGTAVGSVLGTLTAVKNSDTTGTGTGGQLTWNYTVAASAVEYLAAGQTRTEQFDITLNDQKGGVVTRRIAVTITGGNDAIVVTSEDLVGAITEPVTPSGNLTDSGSIAFTDRDLSDVHTVSASGTPIGTVLGTLTAVKNSDTTGTGTGGALIWSYSVAASAVEYLAAGESRTDSYTITLTDSNGSVATRQIDVTITGTNDIALIVAEDLVGEVTEPVTPSGNLTDSGSISFTDRDLSDVHLVSASGTAVGAALGSLSAVKNSDTTGSGTGGALTWNYSVAASAVEYLAAGQTRTEQFDITLDDQKGGVVTRRIAVTITGTNDAIVITSEDLVGAINEPVTPSGNLTNSGGISFTDHDLSDVHTVSASGTPIGSVLGTLTAVKNSDTTGSGTGGALTWTYSVAASAVEYLAVGESLTDSYTLTLTDSNGSLMTKQIDVTITGSNDAIVVTSEDLVGAITEPVTPSGNLTDSGSISFTDRDLSDVHTVSASGTPIGSVLGTLTAVKNSDTTGSGIGGQLTWTYSVAASAVEYLAAGESRTDSYTITLTDSNGSLVTRQIDVTITGTNDIALIVAEDLVGEVTEPVTPSGNLTDSGGISFTDRDLSDVHLVSANGTPVGTVLGNLTAVKNSDTTANGTGGALTWNYSVAASAVEYLATGQTRTEQFDITLDDQNGGIVTRRIAVTITGTNDAIVVTSEDLTGAIAEPVTPSGVLSDSGSIAFTDVDLTDVHTVSATGTPIGSVLGTLAAVKNSDTTGTGTGGALTWTYSVAASAVEYLAVGESRTDSYTITLTDSNGSLVTRQIDVTLSGTNDIALIVAEDLVGAIMEAVTPSGNLTDSGSISFTDRDLSDVHLVSASGTAVGSVLGTLTAVKNSDTTGTGTGGQLTWNYSVAASAVEYLAAGQTRVEQFDITFDDQKGGVVTRRIAVTITGTNDAIVVTSEELVGAITEPVTPSGDLTDRGSIAFADVDLSDVHTVSATGMPISSVLGTLTAVKNSDTTGTGTGGALTWTYSVAASEVEYLAIGESRTDSYTITLTDSNGSLVTKQIDVTITGTNDAVAVTSEDLVGAITEPVTPSDSLTDSGSIAFTDRDWSDVHGVSASGTPIGSVLGTLSAVKNNDTTGSGTGGQLTWTYSVAASAVEYLAVGESRTDSYTITLTDSNGSLVTKQIDVTITGTNDAIVVTSEDLTGAITEPVTPSGNLMDSGSIAFTDVDLTDVHTVSASGTPIGSVLGTLTAVKNSDTTGSGTGGALTWTYSVAASAVEYLAVGESRTDSYTITLTDSNGSLLTKQIDVTITGTNDAIVFTSEDLVGAITEPVTPSGNLTDSGSIAFTDSDWSDVHGVSASGTPIGSVLGSLTAVKNSDTTGSGTGGALTWTYSVAASAVEYLAAGESRTDSYTITLTDSNGSLVTKQIDVTISGTNDIALIVSEDLVGSITEPVTLSEVLSDSGSIRFTDRDLSDVHLVSASGTPVGSVLGSLTAAKSSDTTGTGGALSWNYTVAADAVEYLAAGQTRTEQFDITLDDQNGGVVTRRIAVTITGTNDAIVVTSEDLAGAITEPVTPSGNLTDSGSITFTDVDLTDVHTVSANDTPIGSVLGTLTAVRNSDTTGTGTGGQVTWTYSVAASAVEYLAAGESRTDSYTITLTDSNGSLVTKQIDVTISGTNDVALIVSEDLVGAITEPVTPSGNLTDSGSISFTDRDLSDVHLVSANGTPVGTVLGSLTAVKNSDTTGTGTGGALTWNYSVAASAVEYLAAGQTRTEQFDITLNDQKGGSVTRRIAVTVTGTNDAIVITSEDLVGAITEPVTPSGNLTDSGSIAFTDVDLTDVHTVSATGTPIGSVLGTLAAVKNSDTTGSGTGGQLTWTYSVAASAVEYLASGESRTDSYTITLTDSNGSLVTRQIDVTISGTNDIALIVSEDLVGAITEPVTPSGNLTDSGSIAFTDRDWSDVHVVSSNGVPVGTVLGSLTAVKNSDTTGTGAGGALTWTYNVAASAVEYLAAGQTLTEQFDIALSDQNGGVVTRRISVTITGTNDAILITGEDLVGVITEPVTPSGNLTDSGSIAFTDIDLTDVHTVSATGTPIGSVLGTLTAVSNSDTTGSGTGGALTWTYSVAASAVEYLAVGESLTDSYTITLTDSNGSQLTKQIDITITGTNDAIIVTSEDLVGAVTEPVTPSGNLTDSGSIAFTDVDLTDVHTVSATGMPISSVLGTLTAVKNSDTTGTGTGGALTWTYSVTSSAVEYLAAGEIHTDSFTIGIDDGSGNVITKQIDVSIMGTNDIASITAAQVDALVHAEIGSTGLLSDSGVIEFTDPDLRDAHRITDAGTPLVPSLGALTLSRDTDTTGTGMGGRLVWTYSVPKASIEGLAAHQTLTERFRVAFADDSGAELVREIVVVLSGPNIAPVITAGDFALAQPESGRPAAAIEATGSFRFDDTNLIDEHHVSPFGTPVGEVLGSLTARVVSDSAGTGTGGLVGWHYRVDAAAVEYLAAGERRIERFDLTLEDPHGGSVTTRIEVTILGGNDAPEIHTEQLAATLIESLEPTGSLQAGGSIEFSDRDRSDRHTVSAAEAAAGTLGTLTVTLVAGNDEGGVAATLAWRYSVSAAAVEYLAVGETRVERFVVAIDDGNGGRIERSVEILISGRNDAARFGMGRFEGRIDDGGAAAGRLGDSGIIEFGDVDRSDRHQIIVAPSIGPVLGSLRIDDVVDSTGAGAGRFAWRYEVDAAIVSALAAGDVRVDRFLVTVDDGQGGRIDREIEIFIHGSNDAPTVSGVAPDRNLDPHTEFEFALPELAFGDLDSSDELSFTATLADGSPLPEWLRFDAKRLAFAGKSPGGAGAGLMLQVTATDATGATAVARFGLQLMPSPPALPELPPMAEADADEPAPAKPVEAPREVPRRIFVPTEIVAALPAPTEIAAPVTADERALGGAAPAPASQSIAMRRRELSSQSDQVLAQALTVDSRTVQLSTLMASLNDSELQRKLEEIRRQLEEAGGDHDVAIASSIAMTTGLSVGYVVWLVRGGLLLSSVLSAMPAWQMIDPLPMLASARGLAAAGRDDDEAEDVERMFGGRAAGGGDPAGAQVPSDLPISTPMTPMSGELAGPSTAGSIR